MACHVKRTRARLRAMRPFERRALFLEPFLDQHKELDRQWKERHAGDVQAIDLDATSAQLDETEEAGEKGRLA